MERDERRTLLVAYDLRGPAQNYEDLHERLKSLGSWWHHLDSTWLVKTRQSPSEVRDILKNYLRSGDELLVIDVTGKARAWTGFNPRGSRWLKETF